MIILTGAAGFIGSVMLGYLNQRGITDVVIVDGMPKAIQFKNLLNKKYVRLYSPGDTMHIDPGFITAVIHLGAITNTCETDWATLYNTNVLATRKWGLYCRTHDIPFIFASSAAIYGNMDGPLNQYAFSKQVSENDIYGVVLRLFNVYGPNEYHKGNMASVIFHWYNQLRKDGTIKLFKHSGEYQRDFIWVEDVAAVIFNFLTNFVPGVYDVGTGTSTNYEVLSDLVLATYGRGEKRYIDMPGELVTQYQTNTRADLRPLIQEGLPCNFTGIEDGVRKYAKYLDNMKHY